MSRRAVEILLAFGAQLGDEPKTWRYGRYTGCHALSIAATLGHENKTAFGSCDRNVAMMGLFFPEKQKYDSVDHDTPLIYAARKNARDALAYVPGKGQDINKANRKGETALGLAVKNAELDMVKLLVESRFLDVDQIFSNGDTSLMHAVRAGNLDTVAYLLDMGAKTTIKNRDGHDAMKISRECGDQAMDMLLASVRKINVANGDGDTALIFAVRRNSPFAVDFLRRHGADPGIMNKKGETARSISLNVQTPDADSNEVLTILCSYSWLTELTTGLKPKKSEATHKQFVSDQRFRHVLLPRFQPTRHMVQTLFRIRARNPSTQASPRIGSTE